MKNDRNIVHTVHTDDGALEIYWARAHDDFPEHLDEFEGFNSVLLHPDGTLTWKGWTDAEAPVSVAIYRNRVVVAACEDALGDAQTRRDNRESIVFDSQNLT